MGSAASTVFVGGRIFTAGMARSAAGALAVRDGRIVAVGSETDVSDLVGRRTDVVDLAGGLLVPGFQDAHVHPVMAGVGLRQCYLHGLTTESECLSAVRRYAADHPDLPWILGAGWAMESFPGGTPTRQMLDSVVPDRPVALTNRDGHGSWVNTRALQLAGFDASTPDPPDGRFEREPDGYPSGTLHEGARDLIEEIAPRTSYADQVAGLLDAQQHLFSLGVTGWQDAAVGAALGQDDLLPVYLQAAGSGDLRARVVGALWWDRLRGGEQIAELLERRAESTVGRFRATSVKIMQDGVAENFTAAMTEPYLDGCGSHTDNSGLSFVDPLALREHVTRLDAEGVQVHFHSLGDRAVREALDAVEAARAVNGPDGQRHHLAHLQVVHPDDIPRFAGLGATANMQAFWAMHEPQMDELTIPFLGERRASWQYPFGDLLRAGASLAAGSDWPVTTADPLAAIHVAVNRSGPGEVDAEPLFAHNRLSLAQALTAYTYGSARVNGAEEVTGRLVEGAYADLAVLDRDPFDGPARSIADTRVLRTYVEGGQVFAAE